MSHSIFQLGTHYVAKAGLELAAILQPQPTVCWDFRNGLSCLAQEGISWMLESHSLDMNPGSVTTSRETGTVGTSPDEASGLLTVSPTHKQQQQQQNRAESTSRGEFVSGLYWSRLYTLKLGVRLRTLLSSLAQVVTLPAFSLFLPLVETGLWVRR